MISEKRKQDDTQQRIAIASQVSLMKKENIYVDTPAGVEPRLRDGECGRGGLLPGQQPHDGMVHGNSTDSWLLATFNCDVT